MKLLFSTVYSRHSNLEISNIFIDVIADPKNLSCSHEVLGFNLSNRRF